MAPSRCKGVNLSLRAPKGQSNLPMPQILPATIKDIPIVAAIENQLFPQPWTQKSFEEILDQEAFWFWVAKKGQEIVGYLVCQVVEKEAELHNIAVANLYQRHGIAKLFLKELKRKLVERGVVELFLMVRASNITAQKLYTRFGFQKTGRRPHYYNDPKEEGWIYQLDMTS